MSYRILIVEDEFFVAFELENLVLDLGHEPLGIATDRASAQALASETDIAIVDLNLDDGPTGAGIGRMLAREFGVTVIYSTANPSQLGTGIPGTLGVLPKPASEAEIRAAITYAIASREHVRATPPRRLQLFEGRAEGLVAHA